MRLIRDAGFVQTQAEFQPGVTSIAAPIFNSKKEVLGSLMLVIRSYTLPDGWQLRPVAALEAWLAVLGVAGGLVFPGLSLEGGRHCQDP